MLGLHNCFIIFLVLCLICIKLAVASMLLVVINWPSWSNMPLIMGDVADEFNLVLSTKILSIALLELF
jgi:hypothetical protein